MPTLAVISTSPIDRSNGAETAAPMRVAMLSACARPLTSSQSTTNSSPDVRAEGVARSHPRRAGDRHGNEELVADAVP